MRGRKRMSLNCRVSPLVSSTPRPVCMPIKIVSHHATIHAYQLWWQDPYEYLGETENLVPNEPYITSFFSKWLFPLQTTDCSSRKLVEKLPLLTDTKIHLSKFVSVPNRDNKLKYQFFCGRELLTKFEVKKKRKIFQFHISDQMSSGLPKWNVEQNQSASISP